MGPLTETLERNAADFDDRPTDVGAAYAAERLGSVRRGVTTYGAIATVLILLTTPIALTVHTESLTTLLLIRALGVGGIILVLALLQTPWGGRHPHGLGLLMLGATGAMVQGLILTTGEHAGPISMTVNFALVGIAIIIPWTAVCSAAGCAIIVGGYLVSSAAFGQAAGNPEFYGTALVYASTSALTIIATAGWERLRRREFTQRWAVTEKHREARAREQLLRTVIEGAPVVLYAMDRSGCFTMIEGRPLARLSLRQGDVVGRHYTAVLQHLSVPPEDHAPHFESALGGTSTMWVAEIGDTTFECLLEPTRDRRGRLSGAVGLSLDVSDRRKAEAAHAEMERKLIEAHKLESLGLLAGGIAHDFNNLLVSVLGSSSLAASELPPDSPVRSYLSQIDRAARDGAELTHQMLDYAGKGTVAREPVHVNAVIEETRPLLHASTAKNTVRYELATDLPAIATDPTQVRQMVMNLVINAAEAIGPAGGTIAIRTGVANLTQSELDAMQHSVGASPGTHLYIEVVDSGSGMDAATMDKIFVPFFSTKFAGRGMGLASVIGLVRAHKGALRVSSRPNLGSTFRICLPYGAEADVGVATGRADQVASPNAPLEGRTVLLVEDEQDVRDVTASMLEHLGCRVLLADDGEEGVNVFRSNAELVDAVIVDLTLPRLDGEATFKAMRTIRPDTAVILTSGYDGSDVSRRLKNDGLAGFLGKPFSLGDLRDLMQDAIGRAS